MVIVQYIYIFIPSLFLTRFHYYDCLVVPKYSLTTQFPWQRVSLLVEYEHTVDITLPNNVPSLEHVMLKCVSHSFPGLSGQDANSLNQGG